MFDVLTVKMGCLGDLTHFVWRNGAAVVLEKSDSWLDNQKLKAAHFIWTQSIVL